MFLPQIKLLKESMSPGDKLCAVETAQSGDALSCSVPMCLCVRNVVMEQSPSVWLPFQHTVFFRTFFLCLLTAVTKLQHPNSGHHKSIYTFSAAQAYCKIIHKICILQYLGIGKTSTVFHPRLHRCQITFSFSCIINRFVEYCCHSYCY